MIPQRPPAGMTRFLYTSLMGRRYHCWGSEIGTLLPLSRMKKLLETSLTVVPATPPAGGPRSQRAADARRRLARAFAAVTDPPERWHHALAATLAVAIAAAAAITIAPVLGDGAYAFIITGVVIATWYAGLRFGLAATALAAVVGWLFIAEPRMSLTIQPVDFFELCLTVSAALAASIGLSYMRRAQRRAEGLAEQLGTLADALPALISYCNTEQRYVFTNRSYEVWYGQNRDEINGRLVEDVLGAEAYKHVRPYVEEALRGKRATFESLITYPRAGQRWVEVNLVPDITAGGVERGYFVLVQDRTRRKRVEERLVKSEARARAILEAAQDGIITIGASGRIESFNGGAERLFGYRAHEVLGKSMKLFMPQTFGANNHEALAEHMAQDQVAGNGRDQVARRKDGSMFPVSLAVSEVPLPDERLFIAIVHDLSQREEAEKRIRLSERRYRSLVDAASSVIWEANAEGQITAPHPQWERYTGQRWPDYRGWGFIEMIHPDDRAALITALQEALTSHSPQHAVGRVWHTASQSWHHTETFGAPLESETGELLQWIATTQDVEDRYQVAALEHLRASDKRTRLAESAARMGTWEWDLNGHFVWSEGLERILELDPAADHSPQSLLDRVHPDDRPRVVGVFERAAREHSDVRVEFRTIHADGDVRWLSGRGSLMAATASSPTRMAGIAIDMTEQVTTREALERAARSSSDALAVVDAILDTTPMGIALFDREMRFLRVNQAAAEMNGRTVEQHLGRKVEDVVPGVGPTAAARYRRVWETGRAMAIEEIAGETPAQPGVLRFWDHSAVPVKDRGGEIRAVAVIFNEITARKRAEQALLETADDLRHANAAKDEFLGLVSHELKTPLTTIRGNAEVLRRVNDRLDAETRRQALDDIYGEAIRLQRIIENMLVLARLERGQQSETEPLLLRHIVERVVEAHRERAPRRRFEEHADDAMTMVLASPDYIEQVVDNLLSNAEKYSPEDAPIEVAVRRAGDEVTVGCDGPRSRDRAGRGQADFRAVLPLAQDGGPRGRDRRRAGGGPTGHRGAARTTLGPRAQGWRQRLRVRAAGDLGGRSLAAERGRSLADPGRKVPRSLQERDRIHRRTGPTHDRKRRQGEHELIPPFRRTRF